MHVHFLNGSVKNKLMLVLPRRLTLGNLNPIDCQAVVGSIICASFFAIFAIYAHIVAGTNQNKIIDGNIIPKKHN